MDDFLYSIKPPELGVKEDALEISAKRDFAKLCALISMKSGISNPDELTAFRFYSLLDAL